MGEMQREHICEASLQLAAIADQNRILWLL